MPFLSLSGEKHVRHLTPEPGAAGRARRRRRPGNQDLRWSVMDGLVLSAQGWISVALGVGALLVQGWAFVDALTHPSGAYPAAGKRTKGLWLVLTGAATAIGFVSLFGPLNLFNLLAIVAAAVYLTDVRPAVRATRRGRGSSGYRRW